MHAAREANWRGDFKYHVSVGIFKIEYNMNHIILLFCITYIVYTYEYTTHIRDRN